MSTTAIHTLLSDLVSNSSMYFGIINSDNGSVEWNINIPPNGSYTLYVVKGTLQAKVWKTPTTVSITDASGSIVYSAFVEVDDSTGGVKGDIISFVGTMWSVTQSGITRSFIFGDGVWQYLMGAGIVEFGTFVDNGNNTATLTIDGTGETATVTVGGNGTSLTTTLTAAAGCTFIKQP